MDNNFEAIRLDRLAGAKVQTAKKVEKERIRKERKEEREKKKKIKKEEK